MTKKEMLADPNSCWNKAADDEPMFVLLARDLSASGTVEDWMNRRMRYGQNKPGDPKLDDAIKVAWEMVDWRRANRVDHA